jgi:outer membrane PBP1 activator LpoA protein
LSQRPAQPKWQNLRHLFGVLALTMLVGACSSVPKTIAPSAMRAAELALRGEHSAAAREYDALAAGRAAEGDEFRLLATEQWLSASDPTNAMVSLRSIVGPLAPTDTYARDLFAIEINVLQAEYAAAWQALANVPAPRGDAQT